MIGLTVHDVVSRLNGFIRLVAIVGGLTMTSACATAKEIHWKEQVRLSTGKEIVVERGEKLRLVGEPGRGSNWLFDEAWLRVKLPGTGETAWQGALSPLVLNVTPQGEWYLLGIVRTSRGEREYRLPGSKRYVTFKLREGAWHRIPFGEFPEEFQPNLLGNTSRLFLMEETPSGAVVDFEMKRKVDSVPTLDPAYRRIDRSLGE